MIVRPHKAYRKVYAWQSAQTAARARLHGRHTHAFAPARRRERQRGRVCHVCVGISLDNRVPCECTQFTDGEYAYIVDGCLNPSLLQQKLEKKSDKNLLYYCQPGACPSERNTDEVCKGDIQQLFF